MLLRRSLLLLPLLLTTGACALPGGSGGLQPLLVEHDPFPEEECFDDPTSLDPSDQLCDDALDIGVTNQTGTSTSSRPNATFSGLSTIEGASIEDNSCPASLPPAGECTIRILVRFQTSHGVRMHVNAGSHAGSVDIGQL